MSEHVRFWRYQVSLEREQEFRQHYATDGTWAELFRQADGYIETTLWQDAAQTGTWYTQDRWRREEDFEAFKSRFESAYTEMDRQLEGLATSEEFLGAMNRA